MRVPEAPPNFRDVVKETDDFSEFLHRLQEPDSRDFIRRANDNYLHWDKLRYHPLPEGVSPRAAWAAVMLSRITQRNALPLSLYDSDTPFTFWSPPQHLEWLHNVDKQTAGVIGVNSPLAIPCDTERYLINSLMEEAIASSQLEGATTTREVAKKLLRSNRKPCDKSQQMIVNNFLAIQELRELNHARLTPKLLCHIQQVITENTLSNPKASGRIRTAEDGDVIVEDRSTGNVLHQAPSAQSLEWRIKQICDFANKKIKPFIHPVLEAIILHFAIGFVHPFVDGTGRTARAVFYWYMLKKGYYLFEFISISRIFLQGPAKYARAYLYSETDDGDVTYFIHYHLRVILRAIRDLDKYLDIQQQQFNEASRVLKGYPGLNHRQIELLYDAIKCAGGEYTIQNHAGYHNVVVATARKDLLDLEQRGLLTKELRKRQWNFVPTDGLLNKITRRKKTTK